MIASNRRYMRGAGTANHTADYYDGSGGGGCKDGDYDPAAVKKDALRTMRTCAISNQPLQFGEQTIVTCPYGRLYHKEAAVEALLKRKKQQQHENGGRSSSAGVVLELGNHIRRLKDLHEVRFHFVEEGTSGDDLVPSCPITGAELNGQVSALALLPGRPNETNVVSENALNEIGADAVSADYGPVDTTIRLAPPPSVLKDLKETLQLKRKSEKASKKKSKNDKKRKRSSADEAATNHNGNDKIQQHRSAPTKTKLSDSAGTVDSVAEAARLKVSNAVQKNKLLSSLFTSKTEKGKISEKERNDNLFAR